MPPRAPKSMPTPGIKVMLWSMSASCVWPLARRSVSACAWVVPAGRCEASAPSKMMLVALPRILGPMTANETLPTARIRTTMMRGISGRSRPSRRPKDLPKFLDFSGGRLPIIIPPGPMPPGRPRGEPLLRRRPEPPVAVACPARSCGVSLRFGQLRVDDLLVGLVGLKQLGVSADTHDPAFVHDDDPISVEDRADALRNDEHG